MPFTTVEFRGKTGQINPPKKLLSSGTATGEKEKNWPIAEWRVPSYDPRNNFEVPVHFSILK